MKIPKPISNLIDAFEMLPGIGPKTAGRLAFYLLHVPKEEVKKFADSLIALKNDVKMCSICKNVDDVDPCSICSSGRRNNDMIMVVASPLDLLAFEKVGYNGLYHVLHGIINPLSNIGPDEIYINELVSRLKGRNGQKCELILATNTSMEGESTSMYISKLIRESGFDPDIVRITRIARGLPVGGDIEYADDMTLSRALEGRSDLDLG